jgi:hypothetical protein
MFRSPVVHIGYQKTATSFLQTRVFSDRRHFSQPWGEQAAEAIEHFVLVHPQKFDPDIVRSRLLACTNPDDITLPVLSHEDLSGYPIHGLYYAEKVASRIHAAFPEARIIIAIRSQPAMLLSQYFQYVRQGGALSIEELISIDMETTGFRPTVRLDHFEYDLMLAQFLKYFPSKQILVQPIELLRQNREVYFERLADFLGIDEILDPPQEIILASRPDALMHIERFLNRIVQHPGSMSKPYSEWPLSYRAKNRVLRLTERLIKNTGFLTSKDQKIRAFIAEIVGDYYNVSNEKLTKMTGLDLKALGYQCIEQKK